MKIRFDYVTNSSSTSFVIICRGRPDKGLFMNAMGLKADSPLGTIYDELYDLFVAKMEKVQDLARRRHGSEEIGIPAVIEEYARAPGLAAKVKRAMEDGMDVWVGTLDSDGEGSEPFFCCESFEVEHPHLYINSLSNGW